MSQISKCPTLRVVLGYWEALGEVSEMRYNNLLYSSSKRSYCTLDIFIQNNTGEKSNTCKQCDYELLLSDILVQHVWKRVHKQTHQTH